ncbi:MAG: hypothetical protein MUP24_08890 [Gillisia sp.]|nr:hypothetical protein [Gillisia sp.]
MENNTPTKERNIWNLVLGLVFLGYGSFKLYGLSNNTEETNTLNLILAIGFVAFGIYDLWKYYKAA